MNVEGRTTLLVVYHRPFWRLPDGSLWEREGAFSRYIESLSPHFERVLLAVPLTHPSHEGRRLSSDNVSLAPLPFFDSLPGFFRVLPGVLVGLWRAMGRCDLVNIRLPTPPGAVAFGVARLRRRPIFLLVVGDLRGVAQSIPNDGLRRRLYRQYVRLEEWLLQAMVNRALTVTNGHALYEKHARPGKRIFETRNSTIRLVDVGRERQPYQPPQARLLCVSRVEPRKGIRELPLALAVLRDEGLQPTLDVIGPTVGRAGEDEKAATIELAKRLGLSEAIRFRGPASLDKVQAAYTEHDLLLVPSLPGEGIPRVLLEAMAAGVPVVATRVAGIPDLVNDGENGLLVPPSDGRAMGAAAARLLRDTELRMACVEAGYSTARAHTADAQASWLADLVRSYFGLRQLEGVRPLRLVIPLAGLNLSGGVKSLLLLSSRLAERGLSVRVYAPDYAAKPPVALDPRVDLRMLASAPAWPSRKLSYFLRLTWGAAAGADIVLANYFLTTYPVLVSWLLHGRTAVLAYNVRGYEPWSHGLMAPAGRLGRYLRFVLARLSYRLPFTKLVTTDWLKLMVRDQRSIVVGHGIDLEIFHPHAARAATLAVDGPSLESRTAPDRRPTVVGVIGRQGAVKGYADFLAAANSLGRETRVSFLVARADPVRLPERHCAEQVEAQSEADMAEFYNRCDVFVFPSLAEGFGLPALEAMACGCAVVTTDCGGVSAFARPDENCLMVPPGRPDLLAKALNDLVSDPELRTRLGRAGFETARAFDRAGSLERLADAIIALAARR